jgi:hypothetical protein
MCYDRSQQSFLSRLYPTIVRSITSKRKRKALFSNFYAPEGVS